ncbi:MAG: hypothetical protein AVDCRST_MAG42-2117 [uncultured Chthoniobacterales bacterium]|uniref:Chromosome partition protein Smc n=1 Tax=uncultured Chthoniobacterales bacterium TaxID=1836801 RepID=A0A6J4I733_9BACT|nr:MAG: hypothetical protein AVDCRST_MAG42-2117 [uncultured Chthoniobacterales bacterium]
MRLLNPTRMIETSNPEIDVAELMQRVRAEAAKIVARNINRQQPGRLPGTATAPAVRDISPSPILRPIKRVNFRREKFDDLLRSARESLNVASWIPKPFRPLFRNQDGFNRRLIETITSLVKSNNEMANRIADLISAGESQSRWLANVAAARSADIAWMHAAEQKLAGQSAAAAEQTDSLARAHEHLSLLQGNFDRLGVHINNLQDEMNAAGTREHLQAMQAQLDRLGGHVVNFEREVNAIGAREHLEALQGQADRLGAHIVNVQNEANALRDRARSWVDRLRAVERQVERLGVQFQTVRSEVGKNTIETRSAQQSLAHLASSGQRLEQQLTTVEERHSADAEFIKAIVAEHAPLLQRLVVESTTAPEQ